MAESAFLDNLRKSRLLSEKQLAALAPLANGDAKSLAEALVRREWLTEFQVRQVAAGNGGHLRLGEYILLDLLGEGAMGEVYRASHVRHGVVALKVMRREKLGNPAALQRFTREMSLAARLLHPHIVRAVECGTAEGHHFLAMEFLPGPDLYRLVKREGPLPIARACACIREAALALHHAHGQGIIHRDLKPANLMLDAAGDVKLLDLGLARGDEGEANLALTRLGQVIGTPDYLAPEQAIDSRRADARADIYSLGCTLFYLVAGKPPFSATSLPDLLMKHQTEAARPLKSLRPDAPDWLVQLCGWMMNKRREDRPGSALEVADKIEELLAGHRPAPPLLPPFGSGPWAGLDGPEPEKAAGGVPWTRLALLAALLVGCAGAAAMMLLPGKKGPEPSPEEKKPPEKPPVGPKDGKPKPPEKDKGKGKEKAADESGPFDFRADAGPVDSIAVSADGKRAATAGLGKDDKVAAWDLEKRELLWSAGPMKAPVRQLMFDRGILVGRAGREMLAWDVATGRQAASTEASTLLAPSKEIALPLVEGKASVVRVGKDEILLPHGGGSRSVDFHPKAALALLLSDGAAEVADLHLHVAVKPAQKQFGTSVTRAIWGTEGMQKILGTNTGVIELHDPKAEQPALLNPRLEGAVFALALSPGRKKLLAGSDMGDVWLFDLKKPKQPGKLVGRIQGVVTCAAFALGGKWGLTGHADGTLRMWKLAGLK